MNAKIKLLLELAARAIGLDIQWDATANGFIKLDETGIDVSSWNPWDDDGDAFRLLASSKLSLDFNKVRQEFVCADFRCGNPIVFNEHVGTGYNAAARHVVVQAVAQKGEVMK